MFALLKSWCLFRSILIIDSKFAPLVQTKSGPVRGIIEENEDGPIHKYMGIPYATVDHHNKFGHALPVTPWVDVFEANLDNIQCPQREDFSNKIIGSIDCLVLHVYVPPMNDTAENLSVMVWTHGGSYLFGDGGQNTYGPEKIVRHGVILVTYNYRLGPYGFMCLGNDQAPGNAALMDSVEAFRWVNENIAAFGGNPKDVTAFGQSSGAFTTEFLMVSPISKDLFQKVILQSGSVLATYFSNDYDSNRKVVQELANVLGYLESGFNDTVMFLNSLSHAELIQGQESLNIYFAPCLERKSSQRESVITKQPLEYDFDGKPMIAGFNNKEGLLNTYSIKELIDSNSPALEAEIYNSLSTFNFKSENEKLEIAKIVRQFYFGDEKIDLDGWVEFNSDWFPNILMDMRVSIPLKKTNSSIYYYMFGYDGDRNYVKVQYNFTNSTEGATHADELSYLFLQPWIKGLTDRDRLIMDRMATMWTNFAKYSDPTPATSVLLPIKWKPINAKEKNQLYIDTKMYMDRKIYHKRLAFWDLIYKNYCSPFIGVKRDCKIKLCQRLF